MSSNTTWRWTSLLVVLAMLLSMAAATVSAQPVSSAVTEKATASVAPMGPTPQPLRPVVMLSSKNDVSPPLRSLIPKPPTPGAPKELPIYPLPKARGGSSRGPLGPILQDRPGTLRMPSPIVNVEGWSNDTNQAIVGFRLMPPDTQGDVGPSHYIQWVNLVFGVWDKNGNLLYGPAAGNTLWTGFGGPCENTNDGDIITLYDHLADRWLMSQFALPNFPNGPFYQCIAISATSDPLGSWYRYEFTWPGNKMNDYPKFGVWPDAYYMTANQFASGSLNWAGQGVAAFERDKMLQGLPAQMIYFDLYSVNPNYGGMLPADLDGPPPPAGTPGLFVEWDDSTWIGPTDALRLWEFHVDWANPANSTFGINGNPNYVIPTADVDPDLCGFSRNCIPQPGTTQRLDAISDRLMYRLQYRNFGSYQVLLSNHTVDVDGTDHAGIHWFELRNDGSGWAMYQEGVYAPDEHHRWMGSIAMDQAGNIALGYSVSSSTVYPSIRYTGRLAGETLGQMTQGEAELAAGTSYQNGGNRWGDYSMMAVDPVDGCTFWYTQEYINSPPTSWGNWNTRFGSFQFPSCLGPTGTLNGTVTEAGSGTPIIGAQVQAVGNWTFVTYSQPPDGAYAFPVIPTGTYTVTASAYGYVPQTVTGVEIYSGTVTTVDFQLTPAATYVVSGYVTDVNTGWPLYARINIAGYPGGSIWNDPVTGFYSVTLAEGIAYTFNVQAWVPGYLPESRSVGPLTGDETQNFALQADLATCAAPSYQWTVPYSQDFEADNGGFTTYGDNSTWAWGVPTSGPGSAHSGTRVWATNLAGNYNNYEDSYLESPDIDLSALMGGFTLAWWQWLRTESGFDYADVQVSNDGGATWTTVYGPVSGNIDPNWTQHTVSLGPEYAVSNFRVRFHLSTDFSVTYPGWYVDDVEIYTGCQPQPGGLVVGNVYDANTGAPLTGAQVTNDAGETFIAAATPDPAVDDAFYTLFSPAGDHVFTATMRGGYAPDVHTVSVVAGSTVLSNFYLQAGYLSYTPSGLEVTLNMGDSATLPLTLTNSGGLPASFELRELDKGMVPLGPFEEPRLWVNKPFKQRTLTTQGLGLPPQPEAPPYAAGDVIQTWPTGLAYAWGLGYNHQEGDLWLGDIPYSGGTDRDYRFLTDGTNTGDFIDTSWSTYWAADMAYNLNTGMLWQVDVGSPGCIHELDPVNKVPTGNTICPPFGVSQRGLAYDPSTDTYFAGSWSDGMIHRFAPDGTPLADVYVGLAIAGLAYNPDTQHLFVMTNGSPNPVYVLDVANNYAIVGQFTIPGFSAYGGAGLEMACDGSLWAVDQQTQTVYQVDSGETTTMCTMDVPWLSENPVSGTVPPSGEQVIDVTFDAGVPEANQPGQYRAQLKIVHDTPYNIANVPVTMTVTAPATWGKLNGTVTGLGHCDANPAPLKGALVHIESSQTVFGIVTLLAEDFETWPLSGWSIINNGGDCVWESTATTGRTNYAGGDGQAADADSDWCGSGTTMDTEMRTPVLDLSGYITAALNFVASYNDYYGDDDYFDVDVSSDGGASWTNVLHWTADHSDYGPGESVSIDLTPFLSDQVVVRFRYVAPDWDWWAEVDQVRITAAGVVPVSWDLQTDENGYYQLWLDESYSPLTVTVTAADHTGGMATGVMVTGQQTTTVNFDLRWLRPCVSTDPTSLEATVLRGTSLTQTLTLFNNGAGAADFRFMERPGTRWPPHIPMPGPAETPSPSAEPPSIGRAPRIQAPEGEAAPVPWLSPGAPAYAVDLFTQNLVSFDSDTPGTFNIIGNTGGDYFAGDFLGGDFSKIYALEYNTNQFVAINTTNAQVTVIGTATPSGGESWTGLTGAPDGTLYASATTCSASSLYTIDPATGTPTRIGPITNGPCIIDIAINPEGEMYGVDIVNDVLVRIDPATGAGTVVGPIGFNANYAQGMDFDDESGILYLAAFNVNTFQGELRIADTQTGNTVLVGPFAGGVEVDCLSFATWAADVPWLDEDPLTGTIGADSSAEATITFTAFPTMSLGIYTATLMVRSNDPVNPSIGVPVTMTVVDKPTCAFVSSSPDDLGQTTYFTSTTDGTPPISYVWDFGDGAIGSGESPTHTYALPGLYTVVLTATNIYGQDTCTGTVEIHGVVASFISNSPVMLGQPVVFTNTTVAYPAVVQWYWTFGDSGTSEEENPTHLYAAPGTYTVTLFAATVPGGPDRPLPPKNVYDFYVGTVQVLGYNLVLAPTAASGSGRPGELVTYTLTVTNTGNAADTFTVAVSGNAWATVAPVTVGPLAPGASTTFQVVVTVPAGAVGGTSDTAMVTVTSQGDPSRSAQSVLVTRAEVVYGLALTPATASGSGNPGQAVVYNLTVTNNGNAADTFTVAVSGNAWTTNAPATVGPVAAGGSATFQVTVTVPASALAGASDTVTVTVTSQGDATKSAQSRLTTTAEAVYGLVLAPATAAQSGKPGEVVTYTLTVTNTGNAADTFTVAVSGNAWTTVAPATVGPVAAGGSATFQVVVTIPTGLTGADTDTATVTVTSQGDATKSAQAVLTTMRVRYRLFLPLVLRNFGP